MASKYRKLEECIENSGFYLTSPENMGGWDRIIVANKRTKKGLSGNSFWIALIGDYWYTGTWSGRYYTFPSYESLRDFALEVLSGPGGTATEFDTDILGRHGMSEIDLAEFNSATQQIGSNTMETHNDLVRAKEAFKFNGRDFHKEDWYEGQIEWARDSATGRNKLCFLFSNERISIDYFDRITITPQRLKELSAENPTDPS